MKSKFILYILLMTLVLGLMACEDEAPNLLPGGGGTGDRKVRITGTVLDLNTLTPVLGVSVYR